MATSQDVNVLKRAAKNAVVKNLIELNDAVSIDEGTFRNIVHGCTNTLIAIAFSKELTETVAIPVTQRAGRFINYLSTTVGFKYDHLDTFLVVLCKYGGVCGTEAAKGVAKDYGYKLPKYEAYITDSSTASDTLVVHDEIKGKQTKPPTHEQHAADNQVIETDGSPIFQYPTSSRPKNGDRGIALIINNVHFKNGKNRESSVKDRERLEQTFNKLGYKVIVKTDLNSDQIQTAMRDAAKETNSQNDSFVCCILSHGNAIGIEGVDYFPAGDKNDVVTINELGKLIDCNNCPALADKPKIFFIQACRGDERPEPAALDNSQSSPVPIESTIEDEPVCLDGKRYLPPEADFLFSYSTCQDNAATRLLYSGSDYITQLCYAINKYSSKLHLSDILMVVHHDISRMGYEINGKLYHQMPEIRSTLRGHFKFSKQLF